MLVARSHLLAAEGREIAAGDTATDAAGIVTGADNSIELGLDPRTSVLVEGRIPAGHHMAAGADSNYYCCCCMDPTLYRR